MLTYALTLGFCQWYYQRHAMDPHWPISEVLKLDGTRLHGLILSFLIYSQGILGKWLSLAHHVTFHLVIHFLAYVNISWGHKALFCLLEIALGLWTQALLTFSLCFLSPSLPGSSIFLCWQSFPWPKLNSRQWYYVSVDSASRNSFSTAGHRAGIW